jgi:outer membrane biosynthesis protein TonB
LARGGDRRSDFRRMVWFSVAGHVVLLLSALVSVPDRRGIAIPSVITIDLLAAPAPASSRARPQPPAPQARPKPKPKQVVLPERPSLPKPKPKPNRREEVVLEPKPKDEKSLEDLLEQMREEQGEPTPAPPTAAVEPAPASAPAGAGRPVSPEVLAWVRKTKIRVREAWVVPPGFRLQALETEIVVAIDDSGTVLGTPRIVRRSGNPWYDEGVVRGVEKASPLPPPPESGDWTFIFASDEY